MRELAVTMATEGQPLDRIGELLRVAVGPLDLSVKAVLQDAVERVVAALRSVPGLFFFLPLATNQAELDGTDQNFGCYDDTFSAVGAECNLKKMRKSVSFSLFCLFWGGGGKILSKLFPNSGTSLDFAA